MDEFGIGGGEAMRRFFWAVVLIEVTFAAPAAAQTPLTPETYIAYAGRAALIVPAGQMAIDGNRIACEEWPTILDPNLHDFAASYPGFIVLRPDAMATVSTAVALWIYSHECGHLHGIDDEAQADCFAVRRGRRERWLTPQGMEEVCDFISKGRADELHRAGADRCAAMRQCFKTPGASRPAPSKSRP